MIRKYFLLTILALGAPFSHAEFLASPRCQLGIHDLSTRNFSEQNVQTLERLGYRVVRSMRPGLDCRRCDLVLKLGEEGPRNVSLELGSMLDENTAQENWDDVEAPLYVYSDHGKLKYSLASHRPSAKMGRGCDFNCALQKAVEKLFPCRRRNALNE